jgi:hypothetical protein
MTPSHTAQGLASLGRNGDSMLVHMSPEEVGGLKQVGDSLGIRMSTNPQTGMPEAFSFGDFFTSFLPTIVGAAVGGPAGGGLMASMTPILAGAGTGALLAAAKGDDPLMGGLTGGLGGYGGAGLGQKIGASFGGTTAGSMGKLASQGAQQVMGGGGAGNLGMFATNLTGATPALGATNFVPGVAQVGSSVGTIPQIGGAANLGNAIPVDKSIASLAGGYTPPPTIGQNLGDLGTGVKNLTGFGDMSIGDAYKQFTDVGGGSAMDLAMPVGTAVLAGLEPSDLGYGTDNLYEDPDKGKYRGPQGQLNLSDRFDTGLRLAAGGTIGSGGIRDLYGTPDNQPTMSPGLGGFGLGRLNNLAGEQAMTQAQTLGYEEGGSVEGSTKGITTAEGIASIDPSKVRGDMVDDMARLPYRYDRIVAPGALDFYTIPSLEYNPETYARALRKQEGMAKGGYLNGQGDGMSDSIPATIEGKQPARLADGEFVIPADVVSHLGNGSSKAGSKRLYAMLDKVRHARTGNKKQGKEINPAKYMPA